MTTPADHEYVNVIRQQLSDALNGQAQAIAQARVMAKQLEAIGQVIKENKLEKFFEPKTEETEKKE